LTNAELSKKDWEIMRKAQSKLKEQQFVIGGDLPTTDEAKKAYNSCSLKAMDDMTNLIGSPETEINDFIEKAIRKSGMSVGHLPETNQFTLNGEIMTVGLIQDIHDEYLDGDMNRKENKIKNMKFSNQDWKNFISLCGSCDTVDTTNIITLWNVIKKEIEPKLEPKIENPEGSRMTCNFVEMNDWSRQTCSNYINKGNTHCTIHKAILKNNEIMNTSKSTFPVVFGTKIFYVRNTNTEKDHAAKQKEITRKDATIKYSEALGNYLQIS
jgi:hypothetical protein